MELYNSDNVVVDDGKSNQSGCSTMIDVPAQGSGGTVPTTTPTNNQPTSTNSVIGINIQNIGAPGTDEPVNEPLQIRDQAEIRRILKDGGKVGWNLYLPIFTENLTEQEKIIEITFFRTNDDGNPVKIRKTVKYAPFVMRFDTAVAGQPPKVGQKLYVYTYGNLPTTNVKITSSGGSQFDIPLPAGGSDGGVISPITCTPPNSQNCTTSKTIAWKIPIPGDKLTAGRNVITFFSDPNNTPRVTEAIDVLAANVVLPTATTAPQTPNAPTATTGPRQPGEPTPTNTPTPTPTATPRPTVTPGGPTVTPTVTPTATPIPTAIPSITAPPPGPAAVSFKVILSGIGVKTSKGSQSIVNDNPNRKKRDATLYLYEPGVDATGDFSGSKGKKIPQPEALVFDNNGKFFAANFNLGQTFTPGQYQVFVWTPGYLRKRIPSIQTFTVGTTAIRQEVTLILGDANGDNALDTLDYRVYLDCIGKQITDCLKADFNDDGKIDTNGPPPSFLDHSLFTSQFAVVSGD